MVNAIIGDAALVNKWQELGRKLGLDDSDIILIQKQFRPEEHIQRMVEKWFEREDVCTWEAFNAAKSKVSARQLQPWRMYVASCRVPSGVRYVIIKLIKGEGHGWTRIPYSGCLLYTSPSPRDATLSRMPSSA